MRVIGADDHAVRAPGFSYGGEMAGRVHFEPDGALPDVRDRVTLLHQLFGSDQQPAAFERRLGTGMLDDGVDRCAAYAYQREHGIGRPPDIPA